MFGTIEKEGSAASMARGPSGVRVRTWLLLMALLPLVGAFWFAIGSYNEAGTASGRAEFVAGEVEQLVQLAELQALLFDEQNMVTAMAGLRSLGLDNAALGTATGIDLDALHLITTAGVDRLMLVLELDAEKTDLAAVRSGALGDFNSATTGYPEISAALTVRANAVLDVLLGNAGNVGDGEQLVNSLRVLDSAAVAGSSFAMQATNYFIPQLSPNSQRTSLIALIEETQRYDAAIAEILRLTDDESPVSVALAAIDESEQHRAFEADILVLIDTLSRPQETQTVLLALAEIAASGQLFVDATASAELHLDLLSLAADDVVAASNTISESARADRRTALIAIAGLAIVSLAAALLASRAIGRPLRMLATTVQSLRDGNAISEVPVTGPAEIRGTIHALNEAVAHLELAERQTQALAAGELNHPSLAERAAGQLGVSLQNAVGTLTVSLGERQELRDQLAHEARHDGLTQLPNRTQAMSELKAAHARSKRNGTPMAVMFVDLDNFKAINDVFGHAAGDAVLREVSARLAATVRGGDHIARFGGDEFLVIAESVGAPSSAIALANRLVARLDQPLRHNRDHLQFSASVGVGFFESSSDLTTDELLRDADLAVYKAKASGRARVEFCDEELRTELLHRTNIENSLRAAIKNDELVVYYQQIVDPATHQPVALEALVRWIHPKRGVVAPGEFIPVAERSELIIEIDNWVLRRVASQLGEWTYDPVIGKLPITVNVSGRHLESEKFVSDVTDPLRKAGVSAKRLIIEVTESSVVEDLEASAAKLERLRRLGIEIAIDDFGTGYASLSHLRALPIDVLKIDQSFTRDPGARSLVQLIVDTGHLLGARVVAEGIETEEQAKYYAEIGTDELQGFFWGRPIRPEVMATRLHALNKVRWNPLPEMS